MDDEQIKPTPTYQLGMRLEGMSVEALQAYLRAMEQEMQRVQAEIDARGEYRAAAEALFS